MNESQRSVMIWIGLLVAILAVLGMALWAGARWLGALALALGGGGALLQRYVETEQQSAAQKQREAAHAAREQERIEALPETTLMREAERWADTPNEDG